MQLGNTCFRLLIIPPPAGSSVYVAGKVIKICKFIWIEEKITKLIFVCLQIGGNFSWPHNISIIEKNNKSWLCLRLCLCPLEKLITEI